MLRTGWRPALPRVGSVRKNDSMASIFVALVATSPMPRIVRGCVRSPVDRCRKSDKKLIHVIARALTW